MVNHETEKPVDGFCPVRFEWNEKEMIQLTAHQARRQERRIDGDSGIGGEVATVDAAGGEHRNRNLDRTRHWKQLVRIECDFIEGVTALIQ